jgi:putative copper resistance protein D
MPFLDVYALLSVVLRALSLSCEALMIGGVIFRYAVARGDLRASAPGLCAASAGLLAVSQTTYLALNSSVLIASTNLTWSELGGASFLLWGAAIVTGAGVCSAFALRRFANVACSGGCILALVGSVMTSHSAARTDHRATLIALTAAHHIAAAAWIGGMPYLLLALAKIPDRDSSISILRRFSSLAIASVAVLLGAGIAMSRFYVGTMAALTGTSYGAMLIAKTVLTASILLLGWLNFRTVRADRAFPLLRLRRFAEVEAGIGVTVILAAASLTSSPPAIDVQADRVAAREIQTRMTPRWPRMETPALAELSPATPLNPDAALKARHVDTPADIAWSEYNHHWAGVVMLVIGMLSMLSRRWAWARVWPLAFLGLALFLLIRADSENWPLGPRGFWESFQVAEVAMHRVFVVLVVMFAIFEWRVQTTASRSTRAGFIFPLICAMGGALLLTHSHSLLNAKEEFLAELSHLPLAILAVLAGWSRWLEIRLAPAPRFLGGVYPLCFMLIGAILLNYREA